MIVQDAGQGRVAVFGVATDENRGDFVAAAMAELVKNYGGPDRWAQSFGTRKAWRSGGGLLVEAEPFEVHVEHQASWR